MTRFFASALRAPKTVGPALVSILILAVASLLCAAGEAAAGEAAAGEAGAAAGETPAAGGGEENVKKQNYLSWMFHALGWFFTIVFSLLSLTMVALIVMNIVSLRRSVMAPEELTEEFGTLLDENKFQEAYELAKNDESLLGKVLATGLSRIPNGYEKATQAMQDVEQEETMRLEHQLGYLALIAIGYRTTCILFTIRIVNYQRLSIF